MTRSLNRGMVLVFILLIWPVRLIATTQTNWMNVYLLGEKIGYYHEVKDGWTYQGEPVTRLVSEMISKLKRFGIDFDVNQTITIYLGKDFKPRYCQYKETMMGSEKTVTTWVKDKKIHVQTEIGGETTKQEKDWDSNMQFDASIIEVVLQEGLVPGKNYEFKIFSPELGQDFNVKVTVGNSRRISAGGHWYETIPVRSEYIGVKELSTVTHLTKSGEVIKAEVGNYGMSMIKTTEEEAKIFERKIDVADLSRIKINTILMDPESVTRMKLKIIVREGSAGELIPEDSRQKWEGQSDTREGILLIQTKEPTPANYLILPLKLDQPDLSRLTSSTPYIESSDEMIKDNARKVVGQEKNAWKAAIKLSDWVYNELENKGFDTGFASAKQTLISRKGDCTEHSVLLAALTRSIGIPTKIVVGLAAIEDGFYYHMWTEVYVGEWIPLDPTFNESKLDAGHIKLAETKSREDELGDYALQLLKTLKKMDIEIIEYTSNGKTITPETEPTDQISEYDKILNQLLVD